MDMKLQKYQLKKNSIENIKNLNFLSSMHGYKLMHFIFLTLNKDTNQLLKDSEFKDNFLKYKNVKSKDITELKYMAENLKHDFILINEI